MKTLYILEESCNANEGIRNVYPFLQVLIWPKLFLKMWNNVVNSLPLWRTGGGMFQDAQWMPETVDSTLYILFFPLYMHTSDEV